VISGTMPVATADMTLDFDRVAASKVAVSLNVAGATTNIPFATQAMTGETVLNAGKFPEITFKSTAVRPTDTGAEVKGNITIRGVTHPVTLDARLFRPVGSDPAERRDLQIVLTGRVSRAAFGANGFADMVGDEVRLNIRARILSDG
jgi:polyisoprenoid-binding protein YceI